MATGFGRGSIASPSCPELYVRCPRCSLNIRCSPMLPPMTFPRAPMPFQVPYVPFPPFDTYHRAVPNMNLDPFSFYPQVLPDRQSEIRLQQKSGFNGNMESNDRLAIEMESVPIHRIRDIIIDFLNANLGEYGITASRLLGMVQEKCPVSLPQSFCDNFDDFLRFNLSDHLEWLDDLYRRRRPQLDIQEIPAVISNVLTNDLHINSNSENFLKKQKTNSDCRALTSSSIIVEHSEGTTKGATNNEFSNDQKGDKDSAVVGKTDLLHAIAGQTSESLNSIVNEKSDPLPLFISCSLCSPESCSEQSAAFLMKDWKEKYRGDLKELVKFLRVVDETFKADNHHGNFTPAKFLRCFGQTLSRKFDMFELSDLAHLEMVGVCTHREPNLCYVHPSIRAIRFPEVDALALNLYTFLRKIKLKSVLLKVVVNNMNFGSIHNKTIEAKELALWEVLGDLNFCNFFVVEVNPKHQSDGYDISLRLNDDVEVPECLRSV